MLLNTHTYYSFKFGTWKPEDLVKQAIEWDYDHVCITDINTTSACLDSMRLGQKHGLKIVPGVDFRNGVQQQFVAIAKSNKGFENINRYLTKYLRSGKVFPDQAPQLEDVAIIYPFVKAKTLGCSLPSDHYYGISPQDISRLQFSDVRHRPELLLAMPTVSFRSKRDFNAHRLLRAIDNNCLLSKLPPTEQGDPRHVLMPKQELVAHYDVFPELLENTRQLLVQCTVSFRFGDAVPTQNKATYTGSEQGDYELITKLCEENLPYRYPNLNDDITARIEKELEIIRERGFLSYFLINWDIVSYARSKGYFYVGRGSGANSVIAYLLRITDVDPIDLDLYFERFINIYRRNPPDFDIDFSWTDRDDVTRYIFKRFENVALLATYNTFQFRAVVRELGRVFGLPKQEIDKLASGKEVVGELDKLSQLVLKYGALIQDFPSHLSIHAGGVIISEKPIEYYSATHLPPKGFPTTQFDMVVAEDVGLHKFDILSQRGLGKIKDAVKIVNKNNPVDPIDIHDLARFKQDEKVKEMLRSGKAIGCFYVESPAMRMLLQKLKVDDYLGLVAASSIIRPGVAKSGMMREYIKRFRNPEERKKAHPVMLEIMPDTFGVMVYQEDVIKVAHYFAGLTLGEADVLRRGMSGKYRSRQEFDQARDAFFEKAQARGYPYEMVAEVWRQTESFAGYAFAKGHSASYAVESYQSLFLKAHYPLEYMVATLNNSGGFYCPEFYVHEARMHGGDIQAPCVNRSEAGAIVEGNTIYLGLAFVKDMEDKTVIRIAQARSEGGVFKSLADFVERIPTGIEQVTTLVKVGAFRFTGKSKKELMWEAHLMLSKTKERSVVPKLFTEKTKSFEFPAFYTAPLEEAYDQMELLGYPLCDPFSLLARPPKGGVLTADLKEFLNQTVVAYGYVVAVKDTKTAGGDRMHFGTFLDRQGFFIDTVHFPNVAKKFPFRGRGVYRIIGQVAEEFGFYSIEVSEMYKEEMIEDPRYSEEVNPKKMEQKHHKSAREPMVSTVNHNKNARYFEKNRKA
ncbi:MAG: DNA polymerase III subunit alpha [Salibacteraceae bacterium]